MTMEINSKYAGIISMVSENKFTDQQLVLQSLYESGVVNSLFDLSAVELVAYATNPTLEQLDRIDYFIKGTLDQETSNIIYKFHSLFNFLYNAPNKRLETEYRGYTFKMNIASSVAQYPGAIYMVSEHPGYGYVGRIDIDGTFKVSYKCKYLEKDLMNFLITLDKSYHDTSKPTKLETPPQQLVCYQFNPAKMNDILNEYHHEFRK